MRISKLLTDCGAPLYVAEMPQVNSAALGILVNAGTRDETEPDESGLAHAHEHMVFRGNRRFPASDQLTGYLEKLGGVANAGTEKESVFFHGAIPARYLEEGVEYLYHLVSTPVFHSRYIPPETANIIGEIKSRDDNPMEFVDDLSDEVLYGRHPLSKPVLGTIRSVSGLSRKSFLRWQERFYHPNNFTFIVAGKVNPQKALKIFNRFFRKRSANQKHRRLLTSARAPSQKIKVISRNVEQLHLSLATAVGGARDDSTKALLVFETMIDGGMSFPLFQEIREKHGLGYDVDANLSVHSDIGTFKFYLGIDPKNLNKALRVIFRVVKASARDRKLFREAKDLLVSRASIGQESTSEVLQKMAMDLSIKNRVVPMAEVIRKIQKITPEAVSAAVAKYLRPENFVQVMVAPKGFRPS